MAVSICEVVFHPVFLILQKFAATFPILPPSFLASDEFCDEEKTEVVVTPPSSPAKEANIIALRVKPEPKPLSPPSVRTVTIHGSAALPPSGTDEVVYKPQPVGGVVCVLGKVGGLGVKCTRV